MPTRRQVLLVLAAIFPAMGASVRTTNFIVYAPTPQIAQQVAQAAEYYRKQKAQQWLGYEMQPWPQPCPLNVKVTMSGPRGATSFIFDRGRVLGMKMEIEGPLDRLLASVLPHEVTHTVFAHYFRQPVPRWADEGGSVLSEDEPEKERHDRLVRHILNEGRAIPLRRLFNLKDYPSEVMCLYAEGFSMSNYLVGISDRQTFLKFVGAGMQQGWDTAVRSYYGKNSVEELEQAWLAELRRTKRQPPSTLIASNPTTGPATAYPTSRTMVRLTAPPVQPLAGVTQEPTYRGQAPGSDQAGRFGDAVRRPGYLPDYAPASQVRSQSQPSADGWQPAGRAPAQPYQPVPVRLMPPQFPSSTAMAPAPVPQTVSPVGYPQ